MKPIALVLSIAWSLASLNPARAIQYTFTKIVDNQTGQFAQMELDAPKINDSGQVLFSVYDPSGNTDEDIHYWMKSGNIYVELFSVGQTGNYSQLIGQPHLGNSGKVLATLITPNGTMAMVFDGPAPQPLYTVSGAHGINDADVISYTTPPNAAVLRGNGGMPTTVLSGGGSFVSRPNNGGQIAIGGIISQVPTQVVGVRRADGVNPIVTIADSSGPLSQLVGFPDINDSGTVVLGVELDGGGRALWTGDGGSITTVVDSFGPFDSFLVANINNAGTVAFLGAKDVSFETGIYTGPSVITDKVVAPGDTLDGAMVQAVGYERGGLNNPGQIAFLAQFGALDQHALYIASPTTGCGGPVDGDMNVDAVRNGRDIRSFVIAVLAASTAPTDLCHGDFSGNSVIDAADVPGFIAAIIAG